MADVMIDLNKLKETTRVYSAYRMELEVTLSNLKSTIESVENQWKGLAKDSFTNSHFPKLYASMQEHIKKVERLEMELGQASEDFSSLASELRARSY